MDSKELIKDIINSLCFNCCKRIFHFQLFTITSNSHLTNYYWLQEYLNEKKKLDLNNYTGCGVCFGLLEKYSSEEFLKELAQEINKSGIQFKDFRISLTASNASTLREKFIQLLFDNIPKSEISLELYNPKCLTVKEQWKILTFHPLELIMGKPYNHNSLFDVKTKFLIDDSLLIDDTRLLDTRSIPLSDSNKKLSKKTRLQKEVQEKGFTKTNVDQVIFESGLEKMKLFYKLPFERILCKLEVECTHDPIFLAGRYLKYSRTLSQTKWIIEGERRFDHSIEEIMGEILKKELSATEYIFTSSGREDIDVKCLGKGRPFTLEFIQPKRTEFGREELNRYQKLINSSTTEMAVKHLQYITREQTRLMRENQEDKTKCYSALCYCYSKLEESDINLINNLDKVDLLQKTPIRVLHRRTVMTRNRTITGLKASLIDEHHFRINMTTQAGTYVKEFVHGDLGRTEPSLCTILNKECDILELDVEAVNCEFPPEIQDN